MSVQDAMCMMHAEEGKKPKGSRVIPRMSRRYASALTVRMSEHEKLELRRDAELYMLPMADVLVMCWRNVKLSGQPLRLLAPLPVKPWLPGMEKPE